MTYEQIFERLDKENQIALESYVRFLQAGLYSKEYIQAELDRITEGYFHD